MAKLYWEDFHVGQELTYGGHTVTQEEIIEFGLEFDPQPFHVDPEAAAHSPYGGLIASGWQTAALFMRMLVDNVLNQSTSMGSPGVESLRWKRPVYAGDTLHARTVVLDMRPSKNRPTLGLVRNRFEVINQRDERVLEMVSFGMFLRKSEAPSEEESEEGVA